MGDSHCARIRAYARMSRMIIHGRLTLFVVRYDITHQVPSQWVSNVMRDVMFDCLIISELIFFFLSTLLVQVARHRVSFSGHVDSKSMRLD